MEVCFGDYLKFILTHTVTFLTKIKNRQPCCKSVHDGEELFYVNIIWLLIIFCVRRKQIYHISICHSYDGMKSTSEYNIKILGISHWCNLATNYISLLIAHTNVCLFFFFLKEPMFTLLLVKIASISQFSFPIGCFVQFISAGLTIRARDLFALKFAHCHCWR